MSTTDSPSAYGVIAATARLFWDPNTGKANADACLQIAAVGTFNHPPGITVWGVELDMDTTGVQELVGVAQLFTVSNGANLTLSANVDANPNGGGGSPHVYVWLSDAAGAPISLSAAYAALAPGATLGVSLIISVAGRGTVQEP